MDNERNQEVITALEQLMADKPEEEIKEIAMDIFTEITELLLDMKIDGEEMAAYIYEKIGI